MTIRPKAMSTVDAAWLHMEDPRNLMMISGLLFFDEVVAFDRLQAIIRSRLLPFDRFRQRVVESSLPWRQPRWQLDPNFDLEAHLHRIAVPAPGDRHALQALVSDLMSTPLDYSKPLWQFHLIEGYGTGCVLLGRMHHCLADGIALMRVLLSLTDEQPDEQESQVTAEARSGNDRVPLFPLLESSWRLYRGLIRESVRAIGHPGRLYGLARMGLRSTTTFGKMVLRWPDPQTRFKGELGVTKSAVWSEPVSLADVKAIGRVTGGTVNDVLITAITGALRRYLENLGEPVDDLNFRAAVPVNLRPPDQPLALGNQFGLVFLSLPVGIADQVERLQELKRRMDQLKDSPEPMVSLTILMTMGMMPNRVEDVVVALFGTKATAVITNVPGPRQTVYLGGKAVQGVMGWVPQSGRLGLGISIISYDGKVMLGIVTDAGLIPDPQQILDGFVIEFEELRQLVDLASAETAAVNAAGHCQALTKSGRPCRNRARPGSQFCHVHLT